MIACTEKITLTYSKLVTYVYLHKSLPKLQES